MSRWDALQRLLCRLLTRLYDIAEEQGDSIDDMESIGAMLAQSGGMPPALVAALEAALAAEDLDGEYQVCVAQVMKWRVCLCVRLSVCVGGRGHAGGHLYMRVCMLVIKMH